MRLWNFRMFLPTVGQLGLQTCLQRPQAALPGSQALPPVAQLLSYMFHISLPLVWGGGGLFILPPRNTNNISLGEFSHSQGHFTALQEFKKTLQGVAELCFLDPQSHLIFIHTHVLKLLHSRISSLPSPPHQPLSCFIHSSLLFDDAGSAESLMEWGPPPPPPPRTGPLILVKAGLFSFTSLRVVI